MLKKHTNILSKEKSKTSMFQQKRAWKTSKLQKNFDGI